MPRRKKEWEPRVVAETSPEMTDEERAETMRRCAREVDEIFRMYGGQTDTQDTGQDAPK